MAAIDRCSLNPEQHRRRLRSSALRSFLILGLLLAAGGARPMSAQDAAPQSPVRFTGSVVVTGDVYDFTATPSGAEQPRRPANLWRLVFTPTLEIGDHFSLPMTFMLSSRETNTLTPSIQKPGILEFLQNPMNNLSLAPRYGWAKAYLGSHVPRYSDLSSGDEQIFGAGIDLTPGDFRIAASAGVSQRAIEPDSARGIRGTYARNLTMARIGYGREEESFVSLNVVQGRDDVASIRRRPDGVTPQEGVTATASFRIGLGSDLSLTGEAGASAFTRDMDAATFDAGLAVPSSLFTQRISSRGDYAGLLALAYSTPSLGLKLSGRYVGAGFVSMAFPWLQADRLDLLLAPRIVLFNNGLNLSGSIGYRTNNLSNTMAATSTQLISNVNALMQFTDELSINARYANFGMRNNNRNDTLKIENVTNSFSIGPTYALQTRSAVHTISASWALDAFTDFNTVTGQAGSNNTNTITGLYSLLFLTVPISATIVGTHLTNDLPDRMLTISSINGMVTWAFLENALRPMASVTLTRSETAGFTADNQVVLRLGIQYSITKAVNLSITASRNSHTYGSSRPGVSFHETMLETNLSTQF